MLTPNLVKRHFLAIWIMVPAMFGADVGSLSAVTIMPLGDSITRGFQGAPGIRGSYRKDMETFLTAIGVDFDFVGDYQFARDGLIDGHVQAVSGYNVERMTDEYAVALASWRPDFVLALAGTNNHWNDPQSSVFARSYQKLAGLILVASPDSNLILSTIPSFGCCQDAPYWTPAWQAERNEVRIPYMNHIISEIASAHDRIASVDLHAKIDWTTDLVDNDFVHLTGAGQRKLAMLYLQELLSLKYGIIEPGNIDAFAQQVRLGTNDPIFDLDGSGEVGESDLRVFLQDFVNAKPGDANLDGVFTSRDLVAVMQTNEYHDALRSNSTWETGDWSGDGEFTSFDLVLAMQDGDYDSGTLALSENVAEPSSCLFALSAFGVTSVLSGGLRRTHRQRKRRAT